MAQICPDHKLNSQRTTLSFSVVIPVYNGGTAFVACLTSVAAALRSGDEIIVVADGESDGAWRRAPEFGAKVIKLEQNGGPARARNHGAKAAGSDILFFVDADVTLRPNALSLIEREFQDDRDLAALFGSYDDTPHHQNFLSQYKNLLHHYVHQHGSTKASSFWGACGAIRRELFLQLGGFKESYSRASIEDIEFGYRLTQAGHSIRLVKGLQVTHLKKWTPYSLIKTEVFLRGAPWTRLLWQQLWHRGKTQNDLNLDAAHRLSLITSAFILLTLAGGLFDLWWLLASLVLVLFFLFLNRRVLRFFFQKRGLAFSIGAAFWRFIYDLYCWVGFFTGSSGTARGAARRVAAFTFAKIDGVALGSAVGTVFGLALFVATGALLLKRGEQVGRTLGLLGQYLPGYRVTWTGAFIGLAEGFAVGYLFGWFFATIRNFSVRLALGQQKVLHALSRIRNRSHD